jgi:hypothetical protein
MRYQIEAMSTSKPEDMLVRDSDGHVRLYVGSVNSISQRPLKPELVATLLSRGGWEPHDEDRWLGFEDLQRQTIDRSRKGRSAWRWLYRRLRDPAIGQPRHSAD